MTTQYTSILKLALPVQGELSGTWGDVVNDNITSMIEEAIAGRSVINTWTANAHTLTTADGTTSESRAAMLEFTDTGAVLSGNAEVICPTASKIYIAKNAVGSSRTVTLKTSAGTGIAIPDGTTMLLFCDGTNVVEAVTNINSLSVGGYTVTLAGAVSTAAAFSTAGANALTLTTTGTTNVTLPTTGTLATLAGTETFTNKTLTSPDINGGSVDNATIGATTPSTGVFTNLTANTDLTLATGATVTGINTTTDMSDASTTTLATSDSIKQYVDAQVGANNELSEVLANGNMTDGTNIVVTAGDSITTDSILETTAAAGVDIDGILLKDTSVGTDDASGTDIAGTNVTLRGGAGTGTGAGGSLIFQTAPAGSTGSTVNTPATAMTIDSTGLVHVSNAIDSASYRDVNSIIYNLDGSITETQAREMFRITADTTRRSCEVRITFQAWSGAGISNMSGGTMTCSIWRADGDVAVKVLEIHNGSSSAGSVSMMTPTVSGNIVTFGMKAGNNGTGSTYTVNTRIELVSKHVTDFTVADYSAANATATGAQYNGGFLIAAENGSDELSFNKGGNATLVINEDSHNRDFRVESDANDHMLFVDASSEKVAIGSTGVSSSIFSVADTTSAVTWASASATTAGTVLGTQGTSGGSLFINTDSVNANYASGLGFEGSFTSIYSTLKIRALGVRDTGYESLLAFYTTQASTEYERLILTKDEAVVNDGSYATDFRVESDSNSHVLYVEGAGSGAVGVNNSSPLYNLDVNGSFRTVYSVPAYTSTSGSSSSANYWKLGTISNLTGSRSLKIRILGTSSYSAGGEIAGETEILIRGNNATTTVNGTFFSTTQGNSHVQAVAWQNTGTDNEFDIWVKWAGTFAGTDTFIESAGQWVFGLLDTGSTSQPAGSTLLSPIKTEYMGNVGTIRHRQSEVSINEGGLDLDFRVESDANDHMLFVDAGNNVVSVGGTPSVTDAVFQVRSNSFPETTEKLVEFVGGFADGSYQTNRYIKIRNSYTGSTYGAPAIVFETNANGSNEKAYGVIHTQSSGAISFQNKPAGTAIAVGTDIASIQRFVLNADSSGAVFNEQSNDYDFRVESDANDHMLFVDASANEVLIGGTSAGSNVVAIDAGRIRLDKAADWNIESGGSSSNGSHIRFRLSGSDVGSITSTASGTTYNTTSDRRLKADIQPILDATEKLMAMNPVSHKWIAHPDQEAVHGFIAQEMQEIVPEAVSGTPDGEEMMSMDYGRITPVLVAALQDAHRKIEALEERLAELEAK